MNVYNDATVTAYFDGVELSNQAGAHDNYASTNLYIGFGDEGGSSHTKYYFDGHIDEVSIWNRILSSDEILGLYKRGALSLNLSVRSCDDSACSGESFSEHLTNSTGIPLNTTITPINQYFQYNFIFHTENTDHTPALYNITINYTSTATDANGNYNFTFIAPAIEDNFNMTINLTVNSVTGQNSTTLTVDTTLPNVSIITPTNDTTQTGSFLINASVNDTLSKVFNATFRLMSSPSTETNWLYAELNSGTTDQGYWNTTFDSTTTADATYNITINATDFAGSQNLVNISQIIIDNNPPNSTITTPISNANISGNFIVNASINDSGTGATLANITVLNNTGNATTPNLMSLGAGTTAVGYFNATINSATLADGRYNLSVNATDAQLQSTISQNLSITIDNTIANASIITPLNNTIQTGNFLVNTSINDTTSGVFAAAYRLISPSTESTWITATLTTGNIQIGFWNATLDLTVPDGKYNLTVNATDFANNQHYINISQITIANAPPNVSVTQPSPNANISGNFLVNASVNDTSNVNTVNASINNITTNISRFPLTLGSGTLTAGYWNATFNSATVADGYYNLTVNATDTGGNVNTSSNISITIDNTPANVSMVTPANGTTQSGSFLINASVNDTLTNVFNTTFKLISSPSTETEWLYAELNSGNTAQGYWNTTFDSTTTADATYNITINATDTAGNQNIVNITQLTIDNNAPNLSIISPIAKANISGNIFVNATINDSGSGVALVNATLFNITGNVTTPILMSLGTGTLTIGHWNSVVNYYGNVG